jgi:butyryl-CoA dehydrogenase
MDFNLTREQELVRKMMRGFAETEIKPIAAETDKTAEYPRETIEKLFDYGVMGMAVPKEYGGAGADDIAAAMPSRRSPSSAHPPATSSPPTTAFAAAPSWPTAPRSRRRSTWACCSGRKVGAFGLTEPNAGTDASKGQQTTAKLEGDHYVLNGSKIFITNGYVAETCFVVFAMTDKKGNHGISAFIVENTFPGFSVGKHEKKMGIRGSSTCELIFEDCIVPKENLLGKEGKGFKIAMSTLDGGRIGIAAQALGMGEGAMDETIKYTKERVQFGKPPLPVPEHPVPAGRIWPPDAGRRSTWCTPPPARRKQNPASRKDAAMAKLLRLSRQRRHPPLPCSCSAATATPATIPVERMMRDAKITEIYEGTSEVQRMVIAGNLGVN